MFFGLDFLFGSMLWALPLAGLPLLLHLLFRRKAPVVLFSTLRFIRSSLQHTAARRRIQRWLLLACRILLLLLLIWAVAQPVKIIASGWLEGGRSRVAAVVVDTSYSMLLRQGELSLLERADGIIADLLNGPLRDAQVAILRGGDDPSHPVQLQSVSAVQSTWSALRPQPSPRPLVQRLASATELLSGQRSDQKWLVVITDLQGREFPQAMPQISDARVIVFDLHPEQARSIGITSVRVEPEQPIPGVGSDVVVEVAGRSGDARAVTLALRGIDGRVIDEKSPLMAAFDSTGRVQVRFPLPRGLPAERWLLLAAGLQGDDAMEWDNQRTQLVQTPPQQKVRLVTSTPPLPSHRFIRLALDPMEGREPSWPLKLGEAGKEDVRVMTWTDWPDAAQAAELAALAAGGGRLIIFLQPGIEQSWSSLPRSRRDAIAALLPAEPVPDEVLRGMYRAGPAVQGDPLVEGFIDEAMGLSSMVARRFVPLAAVSDPRVTTILKLSPATPTPGLRTHGLLYRRAVGLGKAYVFSTLPELRYTNLATHPLFLPIMVRMALPSAQAGDVQNVEVGQPLVLPGDRYGGGQLEVQAPGGELYLCEPARNDGMAKYVFAATDAPGLYRFRKPGGGEAMALGNVQLPAAESDLAYRPAHTVVPPGPNVLVVRSYEDLVTRMAQIDQPLPRWSPFLAVVLLLICVEALLGSMSHLWKPISLRALVSPSEAGAA